MTMTTDDDDDDDPDGGLQGVDWTSVPDPVRRHMEARQHPRGRRTPGGKHGKHKTQNWLVK